VSVAPQRQREGSSHWSDERLVAECQNGNEKAWSGLIDKYKNLIYSIPIKMGMYDDAADIFQAVCVDLLSSLPKLRQARALPKWLIETCYHKCLQYRAKSQKHAALRNQSGEETEIPAHQPLAESMLVELEKEQMLRQAISQLNPRCEQMVRMLFYENPPRAYEQVARELDLATGSIGFIRGRCLSKLRKLLENMGF
jgi:RNA polymerase sigma factor (sigma-70 family)